MSKKIVAKTGTYQKNGETKGRYVDVGVILNNENGDYIIMNPSVSLSGVLSQQNALALADGKQTRANVMCSIFDNDNQASAPNQQAPAPQQQVPSNDFNDPIPF